MKERLFGSTKGCRLLPKKNEQSNPTYKTYSSWQGIYVVKEKLPASDLLDRWHKQVSQTKQRPMDYNSKILTKYGCSDTRMTQSPDAGEVHLGDCILFSICRLSSLHTLEIPNSGPTIDNAEGQRRIQKELRSNKKMQISVFSEPKFESWPHFPLPFSSNLQPSQKCLTQIIVGTCFWGPGCSEPIPPSALLLPESPYSPCTRSCGAFLSRHKGDLCLFLPCARSHPILQAHQHPFLIFPFV